MTCHSHGLCPICDAEEWADYVEPCRYCNGTIDRHDPDCPTQGAGAEFPDEVIEELCRLFYGEDEQP